MFKSSTSSSMSKTAVENGRNNGHSTCVCIYYWKSSQYLHVESISNANAEQTCLLSFANPPSTKNNFTELEKAILLVPTAV